jgi:xylulokinase
MSRAVSPWPTGDPHTDAASWIGIDLGTSAVKACLLDERGRTLGTGRAALPRGTSARRWLDAAVLAVRDLGPAGATACGIGLCGLTPSLVLADEAGHPVRDPMTWADAVAARDAAALEQHFGQGRVDLLGVDLPWTAGYPPAQLRWIGRTEPTVLSRARWALQIKDYVGLKFTGTAVSDAWSSKGLCSVRDGAPAEPILRYVGAPTSIVPPMRQPWFSRGELLPEMAEQLGVAAGLPVTVGWSDAFTAMLALGVFDRCGSFALTGTSNIAGFSALELPPSTGTGLLRVAPPTTPQHVIYGPTQNGGSVLKWLAAITGTSVESLVNHAADTPLTDALVMLPFLDGERAPIWRSDVTATISGLTSATGRSELTFAAMVGVAATLRSVVDAAGATASDSVLIGGRHVTHAAWQRAFSAVFDGSVMLVDAELPALGAAQIAALGMGVAVRPRLEMVELPTAPTPAETYATWLSARDQFLSGLKGVNAR